MILGLTVIVCGMLILTIANFLFKRTNYYESMICEYKKFIKGVPQNLEFVNVGTSFARYAFQWGEKGFNFAIAPQTLHYDYKILDNYKRHINKGAVVCISIAPCIFCIEDFKEEYTNIKYYAFLKRQYINNFTYLKLIRRKYFPVLTNRDSWKYIFHDIDKKTDNNAETLKCKEESKAQAEASMKYWCKQFDLEFGYYEKIPTLLVENFVKTRKILSDMLGLCEKQGWNPVIIIMPVTKELKKMFTEQFMKEFVYDNIKEACTTKIPVIDYFSDSRIEDYSYYRNSYSLNERGSMHFQKILEKDLERIYPEIGRWR